MSQCESDLIVRNMRLHDSLVEAENKLAVALKLCEEERQSKLQWADRYNREVLGVNNEGDAIGGEPAFGLKHKVEKLQARIAQLSDGWVKSKERLPESDGFYLVFCSMHGKCIPIVMRFVVNLGWYSHELTIMYSGITHWMPLPPAPQPEGKTE